MDVAAIGNHVAIITSVPDGFALLPKQSYVKRERIIFLGLKPSVHVLNTQFHVATKLKKE